MSAPVLSPQVLAQVKDVTARTYADQAIFYLNAFWKEGGEQEAETVWGLVEAFIKEDHIKGKNGNELNMTQAFSLLQKRDQTLTALQLKTQLRTVDIDANGEMALAEYLLFINKRDVNAFVNNPQGEVDIVKMKALETQMAELDAQLQDLQVKEEAAVAAEKAATRAAEEAKKAQAKAEEEEKAAIAAEAKAKDEEAKAVSAQAAAEQAAIASAKAADDLKVIQAEAEAIAAEIKKEEDAKAAEIARLEALSTDQSVGIVKRNMAVQQLASAKGEDPLPLRKAKLTQDAVVRRLTKATDLAAAEAEKAATAAVAAKEAAEAAKAAAQAAEAARKQAVAAREAAVAAREAADAAREAAKAAVEEVKQALKACQESIAEVEAELEKLKQATGVPQGAVWWKSRILEDRKRSLPTRMW